MSLLQGIIVITSLSLVIASRWGYRHHLYEGRTLLSWGCVLLVALLLENLIQSGLSKSHDSVRTEPNTLAPSCTQPPRESPRN